MYKKTKIRKD